jgi:tetratricopeptide (TPR) repeat protein
VKNQDEERQQGEVASTHELARAFVGREEELAALVAVARELEAGRGGIVTLVGEPGLGKSRLLAEWRHRLGGHVRWLEGRCFAHTESVTLGPVLDLIRRGVGIAGEHSEAEARARLRLTLEQGFSGNEEAQALFASLLGLHTSPREDALLADLPAQRLRQRLFELMARFFTDFARHSPTLLVFEDLHWADASSLELLEHLFALTGDVPLAVVCSFRPGAEGPAAWLLAHLEARHRERHVARVLRPLTPALSARLVGQLLATPALPEALRALIARKAEGNPFFVEELLHSLIERGALVQGEAGWAVTPLLHTLTVPDTVKGVLLSRLDRLPAETRELAQQASVMGRSFPYRVLSHLAGPTAAVDADLRRLEREELIQERVRDAEREYLFKHALTQEVAYESLPPARRQELHRRVGEALEAVFADRVAEHHSVLGEHFLRGEAWPRAVEHLMAAGDAAARLYAHAEARVHYRQVLHALAHLPDTEVWERARVDASIRLVSVAYLAEPPEVNLQRMVEVEPLAARLRTPEGGPDVRRRAHVHYWMGRLHVYLNDFGRAKGYFQRILEEGKELGDSALLAIPSFMMGRVMTLQGYFGEGARLLAQAVAPLERAQDWVNWLWTVGFQCMALGGLGQLHRARGLHERALAHARETSNLTGVALCHLTVGYAFFFGRDSLRMLECGRAALAAAEQAGERMYCALAHGQMAWAQSRLGLHEEAAASAARRREVAASLGGRMVSSDWFVAMEAELALRAGRVEEAVAQARRAAEEARAIGGIFAEGVAERTVGQGLAAQGAWEEAEPHLRASVRCFDTGQARLEAAHTRVAWAGLLAGRGEREAARALLTQALPPYTESGLTGELLRARELLRTVTG